MIKYAGLLAESPMADDPSEEEEKRRQSPPPVEFVRPSETQGPAPPRDQPPAAWVPRPEDYQVPPGWAGRPARGPFQPPEDRGGVPPTFRDPRDGRRHHQCGLSPFGFGLRELHE